MQHDQPIHQLITAVSRLPGLGQRSARRIALHLLKHKEQLMFPLIDILAKTAQHMITCETCGNLSDHSPCHICTAPNRNSELFCIVEDIPDLWAIERSRLCNGHYHVLGGTLSALDGRDPQSLRIDQMIARIKELGVKEVIIATNATVDGQTTAHYITEQLLPLSLSISRLAQGLPMGGELDYLDDGTLHTAFRLRQILAS